MPQITLVQHGDHADTDLRKWNVDIVSDTLKNDQDRATKDASLHRPDKKTTQIESGIRNTREVNDRNWRTKGK